MLGTAIDPLGWLPSPGPAAPLERPSWERDGRDWPHRPHSRFVAAAGIRWHVQLFGEGRKPACLLLHGAGAASHSFRGAAPLLADRFTVIVPDLPGHGFSEPLPAERTTLPGLAAALAALLAALGLEPAVLVGHSMGAAILARGLLDGRTTGRLLVAINGALLPFEGLPGLLFPPLAGLAAAGPLLPRLLAAQVALDPRLLEVILDETGSLLDPRARALYARLFARPGHVAGTLSLLAGADLAVLARDLPRFAWPLLLLVGRRDRMVPPAVARRVAALVRRAELHYLPGLGHLAHEERPEAIARPLLERARAQGILGP